MKRFITFVFMVIICLALVSCASISGNQSDIKPKPQMAVSGTAKLDKKGAIEITGKGFQAGSEVVLLFTTEDGVQSDIGYALEPPMFKAGEDGAWATKWSYGRYVKKRLVKEGQYTITAVDKDFNLLCEATIQFVK